MNNKQKDKIIFSVTVEELQNEAVDRIGRKLTDNELDRQVKESKVACLLILRQFFKLQLKKFLKETVKPNIDVFTKSKTKLLEWVARRRSPIKVFLAFPYNPYHPQPYERFTEQGVLDRGKEFLIGKEYWDFLGGKNTFKELLELFDSVGKKFKEKIKEKIQQVAREKMEK